MKTPDLGCPVWQLLATLATEFLKGGQSGVRCAVSVKYIPHFKDLVQNENHSSLIILF